MQPIIPKGYNINQFPPPLDSTQQAVADEIKAGSSKTSSVETNKAVVLAILSKYKSFFIPHFGTNMLSGIMTLYFPSGHQVKQGGGAGNSLGIAQEIMQYENPSPTESGLTLAQVIALLNSILQMSKPTTGLSTAEIAAHSNTKDAVFTLKVRPTRDAIVALKSVPSGSVVKSTGKVVLIGNTKPSDYIKTNLFNKTKYRYTEATGNLLKAFMLQMSHPDGFDVLPEFVLQYYQEAYKGTAPQFWQYTSKHRLGVEVDEKFGRGYYTVKVFSVDPVTGAPRRANSLGVARAPISQYEGNSGFLLSKVKQSLFPEMYLLSEGVVAGTKQREEHYKDQLINAKNMFQGIPDKLKTPIASVVQQSYSYPYFQGQDPPKNPGPQTTTTPVNGVRVYLQPTGIEDAMRRILDISHPKGNAIEKWFVNDLTRARVSAEAGTKYKYTQSYNSTQWNNIISRYTNVVKAVYSLMDNPHLLREGINGQTLASTTNSPSGTNNRKVMWGDNHWLVTTPTPIYTQYLLDVKKVFEYADWPKGTPQEIFSAPVDDHQDVSMVLGVFKNYMKENLTIAPAQIYTPETFNGTISSKIYVTPSNAQGTGQGGIPEYMFVFDKRPSIAHIKSKVLTFTGSKQTTKLQTYSKNSRTVVSKRPTSSNELISMPQIKPLYSQGSMRGATSPPLSDINIGVGVSVGAVALTVAILGYKHLKS